VAKAAVEAARLQLSYTKVVAPQAGYATQKSVEVGAYVAVGQPLLVLVTDQMFVLANFKETQLTHMRPGQPVTIRVDAYPGVEFHGHVDSIQAGTGPTFSLFPPENATGNFVKIVQRVPVKIVFDEPPDPDHRLVLGLSVQPRVRIAD
jgi:membrane fusion protein (multidrug efflux system)